MTELAAGSASDSTGLTQYANEACNDVGVRDAKYVLPRGAPTQLNTELREYLARPIVFQRGSYSQTSPSEISTGSINTSNMLTYFPHLDRIKGSFGFRATIVIRIEVQATPYHAGRLRLMWEPELEPILGSTYDRSAYLTTMSQLPGVELNLNDSTSMVMRVPFVHSDDYWWYSNSVVSGKTPTVSYMGTWSLWAMHPVATPSGSTNPFYSMWTSLEDVELIAAAAPDNDVSFVIPTVGSSMSIALAPLVATPPSQPADGVLSRYASPRGSQSFTPQAGDPNAAETSDPSKPISSTLMAASRVATYAGNLIPLISSYTGVTSWALRVASQVASAFGWSKPPVTSAVTRVFPTSNNYQHNCDGHDISWNMGLFADNHVAPLPGFAGSDVDEMALSYVCSVPAIVSTFSFATTNNVGDVLYISALSPYAAWFARNANLVQTQAVTGAFNSFLPSPLFFVANAFRYWRGSLTFRFKISKTMFHSGRLLLSSHFSYSTTAGNLALPVPNYAKPFNFHSVLWDLKDSSEIEFTVPYTHVRAYADLTEILGSMCVTVEQPLLAPVTVQPSVFLTVEVYSKDMSFAFPVSPLFLPSPLRPYNVTPQAGVDQHVHGETMTSFKQLLSRMGQYTATSAATVSLPPALNLLQPTYTGSPPTAVNYRNAAWIFYVNCCYAYNRGGTRISVDPIQGASHIVANYTESSANTAVSYNPIIMEKNQPGRFILPFHNRTTRNRISNQLPTNIGSANLILSPTATQNQNIINYSGADDYQCGYFVGVPPLDYKYAASTTFNTVLNNAYNQAWIS